MFIMFTANRIKSDSTLLNKTTKRVKINQTLKFYLDVYFLECFFFKSDICSHMSVGNRRPLVGLNGRVKSCDD